MPQGPPTLKVGETLRRRKTTCQRPKTVFSSEKSHRRRRWTLRDEWVLYSSQHIIDKMYYG